MKFHEFLHASVKTHANNSQHCMMHHHGNKLPTLLCAYVTKKHFQKQRVARTTNAYFHIEIQKLPGLDAPFLFSVCFMPNIKFNVWTTQHIMGIFDKCMTWGYDMGGWGIMNKKGKRVEESYSRDSCNSIKIDGKLSGQQIWISLNHNLCQIQSVSWILRMVDVRSSTSIKNPVMHRLLQWIHHSHVRLTKA